MAADGPADREWRGEATGSIGARAPFDLGDSRDLAAAVRTAYGRDQAAVAPPRPDVPRPVIAPRSRLSLPEARPRASTVLAGVAALAALAATAAIPALGRGMEPAPRVSEPRTLQTTTTQVTPTTAFTYPPESMSGPTTTAAPAPATPVVASSPSTQEGSASTPTTARPRATNTTQSAPRPTQPPAPPPPPDDGSGSEDSAEPPPYP